MSEIDDGVRKKIDSAPVVLFMKGTPTVPLCGYSKLAVALLEGAGVGFQSFDVLADEALRQGIKDSSPWPYFPQVWAHGRCVGGSDMLRILNEEGKLAAIADAPPTD